MWTVTSVEGVKVTSVDTMYDACSVKKTKPQTTFSTFHQAIKSSQMEVIILHFRIEANKKKTLCTFKIYLLFLSIMFYNKALSFLQ